MNFLFLPTCFLIGISSASALGPIFILTFNSSALRGFKIGFCTGLGASLGDGLLFFLGLIGILNVLGHWHQYQVFIDFAGGLLLLIFGFKILITHKNKGTNPALSADNIILSMSKTFLYTILNPLTLFFFMFISTQVLAANQSTSSLGSLVAGSLMVSLGSLTALSTVAYIASTIGNAISIQGLRKISIFTGTIILCIGAYFFFDAIRVLFLM